MKTYGYNGIDFGDKITAISDNVFNNCTSMSSTGEIIAVKFANLTSVGMMAFCGCSKLHEVALGNGTISIGDSAFGKCENLKKISVGINATITNIGIRAFSDCYRLVNRDQIGITNDNLGNVGS
jgi:hypothetical protein